MSNTSNKVKKAAKPTVTKNEIAIKKAAERITEESDKAREQIKVLERNVFKCRAMIFESVKLGVSGDELVERAQDVQAAELAAELAVSRASDRMSAFVDSALLTKLGLIGE